ncbi:hypothetical protein D3C71_1765670 [compost metagenome]
MPPCNWMPWSAMKRAERQTMNLAAAKVRLRSALSGWSATQAASIAMEVAWSSSMYMSTMRCCRAWNLPITWPNCLRVFR